MWPVFDQFPMYACSECGLRIWRRANADGTGAWVCSRCCAWQACVGTADDLAGGTEAAPSDVIDFDAEAARRFLASLGREDEPEPEPTPAAASVESGPWGPSLTKRQRLG